jgi:hypothetical protein
VAAERILSANFKDLRLGLRLTHFRRHYCKYEMQNFLADCLDGYIPSSRDLRCKGLGRDDRIDGLDSKEYRMSRLSETRLLTQTYRVNPDQNRSKEDGDPDPVNTLETMTAPITMTCFRGKNKHAAVMRNGQYSVDSRLTSRTVLGCSRQFGRS